MAEIAGDISASRREPVGIGGWLILPILGFVGTIGLTLFNLLAVVKEFDGLIEIFSATSGPLIDLKLPLAVSLLGGLAVIASAGLCLLLIAKKKPLIVRAATAHYLILLVVSLAEVWGDAQISKALPDLPPDSSIFKEAVRAFMIALIWIPYFHVSKRVRNTFHVRQNGSAPPTMPAPSDVNP